jgi:hypothetical protein
LIKEQEAIHLENIAHQALDSQAPERMGRRVTIAGVRQTSHRGTVDAILFPEVYRVSKSLFNSTVPLLVTGIMEIDTERGEPFLRVEKIALVR